MVPDGIQMLVLRTVLGDKQKFETNYYDRMYENCRISASDVPRHLKIGRERAYTIMYHQMSLFLSRSSYVSNYMNCFVTKFLEAHCH